MGNWVGQEHDVEVLVDNLFQAVQDGNQRWAEKLCDRLNVFAPDELNAISGLLHTASDREDLGMMSMLLRHGVALGGLNDLGESVLHEAALAGRMNAVTWICQYMIDHNIQCLAKNKYGRTALHVAAEYGQDEVMRKLIVTGHGLLAQGFDLREKDNIGVSVLEVAVGAMMRRAPSIIEDSFLVSEGVDSNDAEDDKMMRYENIVSMLFAEGIDHDFVNGYGDNMLREPALQGKKTLVDALRRMGMDINHINVCGNSVLHDAVITSSCEIVEMLVQLGADVNLKQAGRSAQGQHHEEDRRTAVDLVIEKGNFRMLQIFCRCSEKLDARWVRYFNVGHDLEGYLMTPEVRVIAAEALRQRALLDVVRSGADTSGQKSVVTGREGVRVDVLTAVDELISLLQEASDSEQGQKSHLLLPKQSIVALSMVRERLLTLRGWCHIGGGAKFASQFGPGGREKHLLGPDVRRRSGRGSEVNANQERGGQTNFVVAMETSSPVGSDVFCSRQNVEQEQEDKQESGHEIVATEQRGVSLAQRVQSAVGGSNPLSRRRSGVGREGLGREGLFADQDKVEKDCRCVQSGVVATEFDKELVGPYGFL